MRNERAPLRRTLVLGLLTLLCTPHQLVAATDSPTIVIRETTSSVLKVLRQSDLTSDQKRQQIETIIYARVDFQVVSRLVLARNWRRLSKEQQEEFMRGFRQHLTVTYGDNVDRYRDESVEILSERAEPRGDRTVLTEVIGNGEVFSIHYRLRKLEEEWRIIDFIVEGVSMVSNFRSQFQEIMASGGPEKLLRLLRKKNLEGEPLKS